MFFIVNHEHSIIAADADFLEEIGAESIYEAALLIKNGEVQIDTSEETISLQQGTYTFSRTPLSTLLGELSLYQLQSETQSTILPIEEEILAALDDEEDTTPSEESRETIEEDDTEAMLSLMEDADDAQDEPGSDETEPLDIAALLSDDHSEEEAEAPHEEEKREDEGISAAEAVIGLAGAGIAAHALMDDQKSPEAADTDTEELQVEEALHTLKEELQEQSEEEPILSLKLDEPEEEPVALLDEEATAEEEAPLQIDTEEEPLLSIKEDKEEIFSLQDEPEELLTLQEDQEIMTLLEDESDDPSEILSIEDEDAPDEALTDADTDTAEEETPSVSAPIKTASGINISEIAALIGVSDSEYIHFLKDFQKESSRLESHLRSNDLRESREAIATLKEASLLLHLPHITEKLDELTNATSDERPEIIDSYLQLVSEVYDGSVPAVETQSEEPEAPEPQAAYQSEAAAVTEEEPAIQEPETLQIIEETAEEESEAAEAQSETPAAQEPAAAAAPFNLQDVQPIPFDFSINQAAEELTLPASLVSEFIVDFINQAKENIPVIQQAYEEKDLEKIQKTAHMLKGASSNLRITPMADTLYNLQFNDTLERVPELLSLFTGQLKALAIQMDQV